MNLKKYLFFFSLGAGALLQADACPVSNDCCYPYAVTPPIFSGGCGFDLGVSLLYLKADALNSNWAESIDYVNGIQEYEGYRTPYAWDYGFTFDLGYRLPCDFWSVKGSWMHFQNQEEDSLYGVYNGDDETGTFVYPIDFYTPPFGAGNVQTALSGNFSLEINRLDLALARESLLGQHLAFTPFFGLRALFLRNKEDWAYDVNIVDGNDVTNASSSSRFSNNVRSLGVLGGMRAAYEWKCGLEFVGSFSAALLYGHQKIAYSLTFPENQGVVGWDIEGSHWGLLPETDLFLGIAWRGNNLLSSCNNMVVSLGWENQVYFSGYNTSASSTGDGPAISRTDFSNPLLSLTGIRLGVEVEF